MHGVVAADGQCVAVAGDDPHVQFRIGKFHAGRDGWRTAMTGLAAVGFHIIGKAAGAANAAAANTISGADAESRHGPLTGLQERISPAARAPANFLRSTAT